MQLCRRLAKPPQSLAALFLIAESVFFLATVAGCDLLSMEYVPTSAQITASHARFLVAQQAVTGHYANMDVDSAIFSYKTDATDEATFWQAVDDALLADKWKCTSNSGNERHYERIIPKTGQRMLHSAEQARISYNPSSRQVVVAWVQADSSDSVESFSQTGESSFANSAVWPRFNSLAHPSNKTTEDDN